MKKVKTVREQVTDRQLRFLKIKLKALEKRLECCGQPTAYSEVVALVQAVARLQRQRRVLR